LFVESTTDKFGVGFLVRFFGFHRSNRNYRRERKDERERTSEQRRTNRVAKEKEKNELTGFGASDAPQPGARSIASLLGARAHAQL